MHSVMHTLGKYRADTAAARCAVCGAAARRVRGVARRYQQEVRRQGARCVVRGAWRGASRLFGGPKKSAGLTLKMKTRVGARLLVAPRGATCQYALHTPYECLTARTNHTSAHANQLKHKLGP